MGEFTDQRLTLLAPYQHHRTALHYAVAFRNVEAVDLILRRRARLDLKDKVGRNSKDISYYELLIIMNNYNFYG